MKVTKLLKLHGMLVLTVAPDWTLAEAARRFSQPVGGRRFSLAVVIDAADQVVGVLSLGDISNALGIHEERAANLRVSEVMSAPALVCTRDDTLQGVLQTMAQRGIRHMPVVADGRLEGLVARRDALEALYQDTALEAEHLTEWLFRSDARF